MDVADPQVWAEQQFGKVSLGNTGRTRRLVFSAAHIARHPEKPCTPIFDWNGLRGFSRVCNRKEATLAAVQKPHWESTRSAMGQQPLVLILHDTSQLDFTSHAALQGVGPIGEGHAQGFLQHNSLAVVPQPRQVLGRACQSMPRPPTCTRG